MPFVVTELIEDEDYDPLFQIQYKAFINEPAFVALYPGGLDPSARSQNTARFRASLGFSDPQVAVAKVYDDQNGQICAFATMRIFGGNPFSGAKDSDVKFPHVDGDKKVWLEWLFNTKNDRRRKFKELQVPGSYCCKFTHTCLIRIYKHRTALFSSSIDLVALGTDPSRQREGAATLLLDWAVTVMDKKGSRAMLEASRIAVQYGLYEKQDFHAIDTHTYVDKGRFPDMGSMSLVTMVRDARGE